MYFDEDTLIRTLVSVRWMYFVGVPWICSFDNTRRSRGRDSSNWIRTFDVTRRSRDRDSSNWIHTLCIMRRSRVRDSGSWIRTLCVMRCSCDGDGEGNVAGRVHYCENGGGKVSLTFRTSPFCLKSVFMHYMLLFSLPF